MAFEKYELTGKTALITGGAGLLGLQNASALLEAGAQLILTDVNQKLLIDGKKELSKLYKKEMIHVYEMNVTDKENIRNVARSLEENSIRVDILINNAAIDPKVKDDNLIKSLQDWRNSIWINGIYKLT